MQDFLDLLPKECDSTDLAITETCVLLVPFALQAGLFLWQAVTSQFYSVQKDIIMSKILVAKNLLSDSPCSSNAAMSHLMASFTCPSLPLLTIHVRLWFWVLVYEDGCPVLVWKPQFFYLHRMSVSVDYFLCSSSIRIWGLYFGTDASAHTFSIFNFICSCWTIDLKIIILNKKASVW